MSVIIAEITTDALKLRNTNLVHVNAASRAGPRAHRAGSPTARLLAAAGTGRGGKLSFTILLKP